MHIITCLLTAAGALYTSRIDKHITIAGRPVPITAPFGIFSAVGAVALLYMYFNIGLICLALLFLLLRKLKTSISVEIAIIYISALLMLWSIAVGPAGLVALSVLGMALIILVQSSIQQSCTDLYSFFFSKMAGVLKLVRQASDKQRKRLPVFLKFLVAVVEIPIVCGLAVEGLWQLMNWFDKPGSMSETAFALRIATVVPFTIFMYRSYLRNTRTVATGSKKIDISIPIGLPTPITA